VVRLQLTTTGEKMLSTMDERRKNAQRKILSVLSSSDQVTLARILSAVVGALPKTSASSAH
jgi:DNA-binding MarR family transcriptional regulator